MCDEPSAQSSTGDFYARSRCYKLLFQRLTRGCEFLARERMLVVLVHDNSEQVVNAPIHVRVNGRLLGRAGDARECNSSGQERTIR